MAQASEKFIVYEGNNLGLQTRLEPDMIPDGAFSEVQNIIFDGKAFGPRKGSALFGDYPTTIMGFVISIFNYIRGDGTELPMRVIQDDTNAKTYIEVYDATNDSWELLVNNLTASKVMGFAAYNDTGNERVYFCNGSNNYSKWNGAIAYVASTTVNSITVSGTTSLANLGFSASGNVVINGTTYTYSGLSSQTFTGVGTDPTSQANGSFLMQAADTSSLSSITKGNILLVHNAKMAKAGHPTRPTLLELSVTGNPEDFSTTTGVTGAVAEDLPEGGGAITSLHEKDEELLLFKANIVKRYKLEINTSNNALIPFLRPLLTGIDLGAVNDQGTVGTDTDIFYVSEIGGIRSLLRVVNEGVTQLEPFHITREIKPTIEDFDFSNAASTFFDNKVLVACASEVGSANDVVIVWDTINKALSIYRGWNVRCWMVYNKQLYFGSSLEPKVYQAYVNYDEGGNPLRALATTKRFTWGERYKRKSISFFCVEGLITEGTTISVSLRYDDGGTLGQLDGQIFGNPDNDYIFVSSGEEFGLNPYGIVPFGGNSEEDDFNRFRVFFPLPQDISPFNIEAVFSSSGIGQRWKILSYGFVPSILEDYPKTLKVALTS